jgi:SAM-dependent methyltransferase
MTTERERLLAHYYDLEYRDYEADIDFYVQFASLLDPERRLPLLELGCGTGRIALSLGEAGYRVVCVDVSEAMLEICGSAATERGVAGLVTPVRADMRDLVGVPAGPYNTAFCALNTFAYLTSTEDQLAMLSAVKNMLVPHGILLMDLTPPWPYTLAPAEGEIVLQGTYPDSDGTVVHKLVTGRAEPSTQTHHVSLMYDREAGDGVLTRTSQQLDLRWTGRYEMEMLLRLSGYSLENLYGSYDLDEFGDESERMIFVARAM